ncbi:MAG: leucine-rich repeat protein [Clostridia bacterium]|nr:leucine-rich repeat protein [Clostridia bacterium]
MSKQQKRNLEVVSRIDDDIIEKASTERANLLLALKKRIKKTWLIRGGAMAAGFFLIAATVLVLVIALAKEVPVYTGMTVSGTAPNITASGTLPSYLTPGNGNGNATGNKHLSGNHTDADTTIGDKPFEKPIGDAIGALTVESTEERYYTQPGEDVYITIHIDNPDQFEILSFTLNDKKYQNHMFEYGSDLENIILKVNVGEAEGILSYTIDAIKYVDGTEIKDVKMEGDRTVEIGVYTEKQPDAVFSSTTVGYNSISFAVDLTDTMNLFETLSGDVEAVLYDGNYIVARQKLSLSEKTSVSFTGLKTGTLYEYAIIATYDALDGKGIARHIIASHATYTKSIVLFDNVAVGTNKVSFSFLWDADFAAKTVTSLSLYRNGLKERSLDVTATEVTGLKTDTGYTLTATYQNGSVTEEISIFFVTDVLTATVNQYLENLDGTYTVIKTESEVVSEGTVYAPLLGSYEGFLTPTVPPVTLTDSSHIFDCYFERIVYAVTFVDNNGSIVTENIKYGKPLSTEVPARDGFTFGGWYLDVNLTTQADDTVPANALTVYAKWLVEATAADLSYTVSEGKATITGLLNPGLTDLVIPAYIGGIPVVAIGDSAFADKTALRTVKLPDTVTEIKYAAFARSGLTEITWSKNLLTIGVEAFKLTPLASLTIPASVADIGAYAFAGCAWLTAITIEDRTTTLTVGDLAFRMSGAAGIDSQLEKVIVEDLADWFNIVFPASGSATNALGNPLHLGADLYVGDTLVESLTIPEGVTSVRPCLFAGCTSITSVIIPASVTSVNAYAFADCTNLQYALFAAGSRAGIGRYAFQGCTSLSSVTLPTSLAGIPQGVFSGCTALSGITIPDTVTSIDASAFEGCAVTVVNGISYIGSWALGGTPTDGTLSLRAGTVGIADYAFRDVSITGTVTLPEGLKYIGTGAFLNFTCSGTLTIPDSVISVGRSTFEGSSLVDEDTETGLVYVDKWLINALNYYGSSELTDLRADTVGIAAGAGFSIYSDAALIAIPEGIKHLNSGAIRVEYNDPYVLSLPASLLTFSEGSISLNSGYWQAITVDAANTVFSGAGSCLVERATGTLVLGSATSIIPTDGSVTAIGVNAFEGCKGLTAIHIPASVTEIRTSAFYGCTSLATLTFAENSQLKVIWGSAFYGCRQLTGVVLPDSLTTLYHGAFTTYKSGGYIVVPTSVTTADLSFMAPNGIIYYCGEAGPAADMILPPSRIQEYNMAIYYYSATRPAENHGNYWHYVDGTPTVWSANA